MMAKSPRTPERIESPADPRIAPFVALKDRDIAREHGLFIAEGEHLLQRLIDSPLRTDRVLLSDRRAAEIAPTVTVGVPVYVATDAMMRDIIGYKFHSGVIAAGVRPGPKSIDEVVLHDRQRLTLVVLPEIANAENLGALFRIAAGFGADAVVLGERSADPFWRQCVRVSMGNVFKLPLARSDDLVRDLRRLHDEWGISIVGTVLDERAESLATFQRDNRTAVLFGNEAQGLDSATMGACDRLVTIPMKLGTDSLNVAVAAGIVMYELTR
jgi:tRNA G18 (ribose-2'-O)-methylase SpoU